jgi:hypothetical protein
MLLDEKTAVMKGHEVEESPKGADAKGAELDSGDPHAAKTLTFAQAEDIALKLDGCIGFTFEGQPYKLQQLQTQQDILELKKKRTDTEEDELKELAQKIIEEEKRKPDQTEGPIHFISGPAKKFFVARENEEPIVTATKTGEKDNDGNVKEWQAYGACPKF